jgi:hypothetical protein
MKLNPGPLSKVGLSDHTKVPKMLDLNPDILMYSKHGDVSVIFRNNLNEIWDFTSIWVLLHPRQRDEYP